VRQSSILNNEENTHNMGGSPMSINNNKIPFYDYQQEVSRDSSRTNNQR